MNAEPEELAIPGHLQTWQALTWGPQDGTPVLALHGWLDNAATFWWLAPKLPADWRIVAVDMAGHGRSDHKPPGATYPFTEWVLDIYRILDHLGWDKVTLLGHSMGAGICGLFSGTFAERVRAFAAIEGIAPLTSEPAEAPQRLRSYVEEETKRNRRPAKVYPDIESAVAVRAMAGDFADREALKPMVTRNLREQDGGWTWTTDVRLRRPSATRMTREQVASFLSGIASPVLLIRASEGLQVAADSIARIRDLVPRLAYIEVAGFHHPHLDTPDPVATAICQWWDGLTP